MAKRKNTSYISGKESRQITRFNRRLTRRLEKERASKAADPSKYMTTMRDENNIVEFDNVCSYFFSDVGTVKAVDGVSFDVPRRATVGIVGESGCGKSVTSLSLMQLLQRPQGQTVGGEIRLNMGDGKAYNIVNTPTSEMMKIRGNRVSMIFQDPMTALNPVFTVGEQIAESLELHEHLDKKAAMERAKEMLELVGIPGSRANEYPHQFSGGMKQRVVIAIALACDPDLLICDEPTTALDVTIQAKILELIRSIQKERGISVIYITHDLGVVAKVADYVDVMYAGKIVETGTIDEIFYDPKHPYTWGLLSAMPDLDTADDRLYTIPGSPPNLLHEKPGDAFAPRNRFALHIDDEVDPPMFKISETHYAATWLLDPRAPKVEMPPELKDRVARMSAEAKKIEEAE